MSLSPKELAQNALDANRKLQYQLTQRAEEIQADITELEGLMDAATIEASQEEDISIPGATKAISLIPAYQLLNRESPFFEDAERRTIPLNKITRRPMNERELEALENAVEREELRLQALEDKERSQSVGSSRSVDNDNLDWKIIAEKVSYVSSYTRSAEECRIAWVGKLGPPWGTKDDLPPEESEKLKDVISNSQVFTSGEEESYWSSIAEKLGTNRTPIACRKHGAKFIRYTWSNESDTKLLAAVDKYGVDNWGIVARSVSEYLTPDQCKSRYTKTLDPSIKREPWSETEDTRLHKAVAAYGNKWTEIARCIPGRTNDQCQKRWTEKFAVSAASKAEWTKEEDDALREAHKLMGNQWKAISEKLGIGKSGRQCRVRFTKLVKQDESGAGKASKKSHTKPGQLVMPIDNSPVASMDFSPPETSARNRDRDQNFGLNTAEIGEKWLGSPLPDHSASKKLHKN